jgi:N-acetylglutamate synthase-like GNAT family acetyltransferase
MSGCVRELEDADQDKPKPRCGKDFIDKFSWGDLVYDMRTDPWRKTYVYERQGRIRGFVSFRVKCGDDILVDTVVVDESCQNQQIGGNLMRWTETYARNCHCAAIHLWAVEERKGWYSKHGYEPSNKEPLVLDGTTFLCMGKKLLYNLPNADVLTLPS